MRAFKTGDDEFQRVAAYIQKSRPDKISIEPPSAKTCYSIRNKRYVSDGFMCYGERLICYKHVSMAGSRILIPPLVALPLARTPLAKVCAGTH